MANIRKPNNPAETSLKQDEARSTNKTNPKTFDGIKKAEIVHVVQKSSTKVHSGPLPDPETLIAYKEIYPDSVKIIFDVFQEQSQHRIEMETKVITSQQNQSKYGQVYAFVIALLFLIISGTCILLYSIWTRYSWRSLRNN